MDLLIAEYASDSSENEDILHSDDRANTSSNKVKHSNHEVDQVDSIEVTQRSEDFGITTQIIKPEETVNYFGLQSSLSDSDEQSCPTGLPIEEQKSQTVVFGNASVEVEIPNTSFWSGTTGINIQALQEEKCDREKAFTNSSRCGLGKNYKTNKRNQCTSDEYKYHTSTSKRGKFIKTSSLSMTRSDSVEPSISERNIYFIHQKIKPFLHNKSARSKQPHCKEWNQTAHAGCVNRIHWSCPSYSHLFVTCSTDSSLKIWNVWSQMDPCVKVLSTHKKAIRDVVWSADGRNLLSASYDRTVAVTDVEKGVAVCQLDHGSHVTSAKYHPVNPHLCLTGETNQIQAWDTRSSHVPCKIFNYKDNIGQIQDLLFSDDGSTFFSSTDLVSRDSADRNLMAWDFSSGVTLSNQIYQERYTVTRLRHHPSDSQFLAQSQGNYIAIFSMNRPYKMLKHRRFDGHKLLGYNIGFDITPDGQAVYSGSSNGKIYGYHYQTGKVQVTLDTGMDVVMDVSCHPILPSTLVACGLDGTVQVWK